MSSYVISSTASGRLRLTIGSGSKGDTVVSRDYRTVYEINERGERRLVKDKQLKSAAISLIQRNLKCYIPRRQ